MTGAASLNKTPVSYIDDDAADDQQFLIEALTENNPSAQCLTAFNGQEALTYLKQNDILLPDAIFLDLNMPRFTGKQCLMELKRTPSLQHIPVIIYSTTSDKREIGDAVKMGASHFLVKKSSFKELSEELLVILTALNEIQLR